MCLSLSASRRPGRGRMSRAMADDERPAIRFSAQVYKVQTLVDGGLRVTLDLPETAVPEAAMLIECKRDGIPLAFEAKTDG